RRLRARLCLSSFGCREGRCRRGGQVHRDRQRGVGPPLDPAHAQPAGGCFRRCGRRQRALWQSEGERGLWRGHPLPESGGLAASGLGLWQRGAALAHALQRGGDAVTLTSVIGKLIRVLLTLVVLLPIMLGVVWTLLHNEAMTVRLLPMLPPSTVKVMGGRG